MAGDTRTPMEKARDAIKDAFYEGFYSYKTSCVPFNDEDSAWNESSAKDVYDELAGEP